MENTAKEYLNQVSDQLIDIDDALQILSKAISDLSKESALRQVCIEAILSARANIRKADIYLANLDPK